MKYGDTLRQRSIAAWQSHNIDYQDIKHFIKINTTPGKGKAVSIPGSPDAEAEDFENALFEILREQDERITWFVRSKVGEIQRRLAHLEDQVERIIVKSSHARPTHRRQERYGRVETDILKVGEEIQALSRFIGVQQEAFRKLIKKYKKWTGSPELGYRFSSEVRQQTESFVHTDLKPLVGRYEELLHTVRLLHKDVQPPTSLPWPTRFPAEVSPLLRQAAFVLENGKRTDFDRLLATMSLGESGKEASYWVHPENVVEVQILLQQYTRSFNALCRRPSMASISSNSSSPHVRQPSSTSDTFDIIIDDAHSYLTHIAPEGPVLGSRLQRAAMHARGVADEETSLLTWHKKPESSALDSCAIKRKCLRSVLTPGLHVVARKASLPQLRLEGVPEDPAESLEDLQSWLNQHPDISPVASIFSQRSRFYNISTDKSGVLIAALDLNIQMQSGLATQSDGSAVHLPYAILTIRQEGNRINDLIRVLDESHLVQRIHDFSLEYHAVYQIQQPSDLEAPYWTSLLKRDLRKLPQSNSKARRRPSNEFGSQSTTPRASTTNSSDADAHADLNNVEDLKKLKKAAAAHATRQKAAAKRQRDQRPAMSERYWNEYDDPSDEENGYVIYLDPNYESFWDKTWRSVKLAFGAKVEEKKNPETEALLYSPDLESGGSIDEEAESSDDDEVIVPLSKRGSRLMSRPTSALFALQQRQAAFDAIPRLTLTCFASSLAILVVAFILATTGKRKLHAEVNAGVIFAVATSLTFAVTGAATLYRSGESRPVLVWYVAAVSLGFILAANGGLLAWTLV